MWYGLVEAGELIAVKYFSFSPSKEDFRTSIRKGIEYSVVYVRVRIVSKAE